MSLVRSGLSISEWNNKKKKVLICIETKKYTGTINDKEDDDNYKYIFKNGNCCHYLAVIFNMLYETKS